MRLTNSLREEIQDSIVAEVLKDRKATLMTVENALADAIYNASFDRAVVATVSKLPAEWQTRADNIGIIIKSDGGSARTYGGYDFAKGVERVIPHNYASNNAFLEVSPTHALAVRVGEFRAQLKKLDEDEKELVTKVSALLLSFTTVEKFVAQVPEWAHHVPAEALIKKENLPAVQMADLFSFIREVAA